MLNETESFINDKNIIKTKEEIDGEKDKLWKTSGENRFFKENIFEASEKTRKYFQGIKNFSEAFVEEKSKSVLVCIDEGMSKDIPGNNFRKIRIAGSGILSLEKMSEDEIRKFIKDNNIVEMETHGGCGAAAKHAETKNINDESHAQSWAKEFAKKYNLKYDEERNHTNIEDMKRPAEFHTARIAYADMAGGFDPGNIKEIPEGFVVSGKAIGRTDLVKNEIMLSADIALGHHGFENRFGKSAPFVIIVIVPFGWPEDKVRNLENKFKNEIKNIFGKEDREKIVVRSIVAPEK